MFIFTIFLKNNDIFFHMSCIKSERNTLITPFLITGKSVHIMERCHMVTEEEITRNLTMIEYYKEQLNSIDMQGQYLQAAIADFYKAKLTVEQLDKADDESEILIPIGGGTFLNGSLKDSSKVLVDIGAGLITEKTIDDTIKKIEGRIKDLQENQEKLMSMAQKMQNEATELSQKTQQMMDNKQQ